MNLFIDSLISVHLFNAFFFYFFNDFISFDDEIFSLKINLGIDDGRYVVNIFLEKGLYKTFDRLLFSDWITEWNINGQVYVQHFLH